MVVQRNRETADSGFHHTSLSALDYHAARQGKAEPSGATRKLLAPNAPEREWDPQRLPAIQHCMLSDPRIISPHQTALSYWFRIPPYSRLSAASRLIPLVLCPMFAASGQPAT